MKSRHHSNNDGTQCARSGNKCRRLEIVARQMGVPFIGGAFEKKGEKFDVQFTSLPVPQESGRGKDY